MNEHGQIYSKKKLPLPGDRRLLLSHGIKNHDASCKP